MMQQTQVSGGVKTVAWLQKIQINQRVFDFLVAEFGQFNLSIFFIHHVIAGSLDIRLTKHPWGVVEWLLFQLGRDLIDRLIQRRIFFRGSRNNERCSRLINQYGVNLVDDGEKEFALKSVLSGKRHIGSQVIEAKFVVRAIDDIGSIRFHFFCGRLTRLYDPHAQPKGFVYGRHPLRVSLC